jgi:hypothetical protein
MSACGVFAFPSPAETRDHVECHPEIFESCLWGEDFASGHVPEEDDHCCDVQWDWGGEEGDVGEADELIVDDDYVV